MPSTTDFALYYASRGFWVFPVGQDKHPLIKWADFCTLDEKQIHSWWDKEFTQAGIGVVTGAKSGIVVLDIDAGHGGNESLIRLLVDWGEIPLTAETVTGGGGRHIVFIHPGIEIRNSAGKLGNGLDIRGDGGYIVAPPSLHPSGKRYEWAQNKKLSQTPLAHIPGWLIRLLTEPEHTDETPHQAAQPLDRRIASGARN